MQLSLIVYNFGRKLAGNIVEYTGFRPDAPIANYLKTNLRLLFHFHGMEEVVGSNPTRSTIRLKQCQFGVVRCFYAGSCRAISTDVWPYASSMPSSRASQGCLTQK